MRIAMKLAALCVLSMVFVGGLFGQSRNVTLNFLEVMTSPTRTEVLKSMIVDYEKKNPGVKINLISPPYEQADSKLTVMLTAKQPLDVIEVRDLSAPQFVANNLLTDLSSYLGKWEDSKTLLSVTNTAALTVKNKPYFLPEYFYIKALFVRSDILAKYGVTKMPQSLDELYTVAKKITDSNKNQFGFTFRGKGNSFKTSDILILSDVKDIDRDNLYKMKDGSSVYDNAQYIDALKKYVALYKDAAPKDAVNWGFNEQINAFCSGITPFLVQDPDTVPLLDQQLGRDKYTVIPIPTGKSGTTYLDYGYAGYGIPSYSKNKDEAWKFIAFMSSPSENAMFCEKYGTLPIHTTAFEKSDYFKSDVYKAWMTEMNTPAKFTFVKYPYASDKFPGWAQVEEVNMQKSLLGVLDPVETAKVWSKYWK